ncbi:MAG: hypothetical protein KDJ64_13260, partial [Nitratireductor sp.]|nr:hypothetical protein [Nitratireductor sp.]
MSASPTPEDLAKTRFFILNLMRILGVVFVVLGLLIVSDKLAWPELVGWILLAVGLADFFVM